MSCDETRSLLHGYLDRELDLAHSLEMERHLQSCPACTQEYKNLLALRAVLSDGALSYRAPAGLERRVLASARRLDKTSRPSFVSALWPRAAVAAVLLVAGLAWGLLHFTGLPNADDALAREVVAGHVRSLMAGHLEDVASTDQHTVKPWFAGRLDFSPPVQDLAARGFPLIGGRLDYLDGHPVAALVYRRRKHLINLFVWPSGPDDAGPARAETRQGYHLIHWTQAGMTEWAVSDLNDAELQSFTQLLQNPPSPQLR